MSVKLNPIRACIATSAEASDFTRVQNRMTGVKSAEEVDTAVAKDVRIERDGNAGWLVPIAQEPCRKKVHEKPPSQQQRLPANDSAGIPAAGG